VGIFLDLTKANDVLNHNILLDKLNTYSIRGNTNFWFKSSLFNRSQFAEITPIENRHFTQYRHTSSLRKIVHGEPQGSVLGPLCLNLYINDLPFNIQGVELVLLGDDTNILVPDKIEDALQ
jgi:Reverse transcriptase (RNA-dependent DNA polymerase).